MPPIDVLVVDDSKTIRQLLTTVLSRDPGIRVVGGAPEPAVARQMIKELNPAVLLLDVEMPNMSGLEFLEKVMRLRPMPVVMVSTLTERGSDVTLQALELGAVDYFPKASLDAGGDFEAASAELIAKVKAAASAKVHAHAREDRVQPATPGYVPGRRIVAIGASTGGVEALCDVLAHYPENCPPTVITQHMPQVFTAMFAARLNRMYRPTIAEATDGAKLEPGRVYIAPGGDTHLTITGGPLPKCRLVTGDKVNGHRPSVDVLFQSVAAAHLPAVGVILTGMGRDGASGLKTMRDSGALTIGQDALSSTIYGMPRVAMEEGAVERQLPLSAIGPQILRWCASAADR
jgi:two-component system chemotaxis response regulator CheB